MSGVKKCGLGEFLSNPRTIARTPGEERSVPHSTNRKVKSSVRHWPLSLESGERWIYISCGAYTWSLILGAVCYLVAALLMRFTLFQETRLPS